MAELAAITALGGTAPRVDRVTGATLTEVPGVALASVATRTGQATEVRAAVERLTGAPAPEAGFWSGGTVRAFWVGPEQWMVEAPFETHEDIVPFVRGETGDAASVTEQSDAWARFDLDGAGLAGVMELLCALDVRRMVPGAAARTRIHHLGCFVLRTEDGFQVFGPRASAGSLHHAVLGAMRSAL